MKLAEEAKKINEELRQPRSWIKEASKKLTPTQAAHLSESEKNNLIAGLSEARSRVVDLEKQKEVCDEECASLALGLPNLTSAHTPLDEQARLIKYINYDPELPPTFSPGADHSLIGQKLSLLDFQASSTVSGWGFYYLLNKAALLEQALIQYALSVVARKGWQIVSPPSLVYSHIAEACGFQPRDQHDEQQIWQIATTDRDVSKPRRSLAATAEIPLAGLHAGSQAVVVATVPKLALEVLTRKVYTGSMNSPRSRCSLGLHRKDGATPRKTRVAKIRLPQPYSMKWWTSRSRYYSLSAYPAESLKCRRRI